MTTRARTASGARAGTRQSRNSTGVGVLPRSRLRATSAGQTKPKNRIPVSRSTDRFEERRSDAARLTNRRRLRIVAGLSVVSCLAVATVALINSPLMDVNEVVIVGAKKADLTAITNASEIVAGQSLLEIDPESSARLVERVSWVGTAEVRRSLSGKVEIAIAEREPLVALPVPTGFALVDHWGRQLEIVSQRPDGYLPVSGLEASGSAGEMAPPETAIVLTFVVSASPLVNESVSSLQVVDDEIEAQLIAGGKVNFGDGTVMGEKIQALETLLTRVDLACLAEVDLRVPSAPALQRAASGSANPTSLPGGATTEGGPSEDPIQTVPNC